MTATFFNNLFAQGGPFDIGGAIGRGIQQGQALNALGEISRRAQAGDLEGAASIALSIGDTQTASNLMNARRQSEQLGLERQRLAQEKGLRQQELDIQRQNVEQGGLRVVGNRWLVNRQGKVVYEAPDPFMQFLTGQGGEQPQGAGAPPPPPTATPTAAAPIGPAPQGRFGPRLQPAAQPTVFAPSQVTGGKTDLGGGAGFPMRVSPAPVQAVQGQTAGVPDNIRRTALQIAATAGEERAKAYIAKALAQQPAAPGGAIPLQKSTAGKIEQSILDDRRSLQRVDTIRSLVDPTFLTYWGQAQRGLFSGYEKAGGTLSEEAKGYIGQFRKFRNEVGQAFNAYRKDITGAGASIQELNRLKETFLNQDLSPTEFQAALDDYTDALKRGLRLKNAMLRNGIDPTTDEGGKAYDNAFLSGGDDDFQSRLNELQGSGMSESEAFDQLKSEGYQ